MDKIAIIGGGSWGTALAISLARKDYRVQLRLREENSRLLKQINEERSNEDYLPGIELPEGVEATTSYQEAITDSRLLIFAVPSHALRQTVRDIEGLLAPQLPLLNAVKGLEEGTLLRMSEVMLEELGPDFLDQIAVLSGPTHAEEVARSIPSSAVISSSSQELAESIQGVMISDNFRLYTNPDLVGVELGGAIKNIIAIAAGIIDGLQYGDNTIAALITRGLAEIARLGKAMGANPMTLSGLAGMGDLVVTCTSKHSRNRSLGYKIGRGRTLQQALQEMEQVAEGVRTARAALAFSRELRVEMPITREVNKVLFENKEPSLAVKDLMQRGPKEELGDYI